MPIPEGVTNMAAYVVGYCQEAADHALTNPTKANLLAMMKRIRTKTQEYSEALYAKTDQYNKEPGQ